jgi:hypothetical protein
LVPSSSPPPPPPPPPPPQQQQQQQPHSVQPFGGIAKDGGSAAAAPLELGGAAERCTQLFIRGIPPTATQVAVRKAFSLFGAVREMVVHRHANYATHVFVTIHFSDPTAARAANVAVASLRDANQPLSKGALAIRTLSTQMVATLDPDGTAAGQAIRASQSGRTAELVPGPVPSAVPSGSHPGSHPVPQHSGQQPLRYPPHGMPSDPRVPLGADPRVAAPSTAQPAGPESSRFEASAHLGADGRRVLVKQIGTHGLDVTASVHPEMAATAVRAARAVGLDIAGIDLIAREIERSPREQGAAVCEVNAGPQLMIHAHPSQGPGQPVGEAVVDLLFSTAAPGRIPIAAMIRSGMAADRGSAAPASATLTARILERILLAAGKTPGLTCGMGKWLAGWQCSAEPSVTSDAARDLMVAPDIDAAVCELDWQSLATRGFPFDSCDVLVIDRLRAAEVSRGDAAVNASPLAVIEALVDTVATAGTILLVDADTATADLA